MGRKLPAKQLELYKRIDEILWRDWDPIGVSDFEGAKDEYHSYLPKVFRMALENATQQEIAKYLFVNETKSMGMDGDMQHCLNIANLVLNAKEEIWRHRNEREWQKQS